MSTIESQIQKLNDTNAELARVNNELTSAVRTHTNDINNEVAAAKNTMAAATASAISEVKADANAVNAEIKARMDDAVVPWLPAMTKVQFDALCAARKQQYAGSGFVEWGKHYRGTVSDPWQNVNDGLYMITTNPHVANTIFLGRENSDKSGASKTNHAHTVVDGVKQKLYGTNYFGTNEATVIRFPPAPDGTKTYDSATGAATQHANAEVAFAAETTTNKVITSRKDLVFLESWHEKIADKDVVYPLGNVQYGASSYEGVTLLNNLVAQGYSAFGEWDENTKGYGAKWSSLTDAQKALFLSEPEHNIYFDPRANAYIQVRYRIRVVEGLGDEFDYSYAYKGISKSWRPKIDSTNFPFFNVRGQNVLSDDYYDSDSTSANGYFNPPGNSHRWSINDGDFEGYASKKGIGHNNRCLAVPIALVQRMNQGAYHPTYNPMGTAKIWRENGFQVKWHSSEGIQFLTSKRACFDYSVIDTSWELGKVVWGRFGPKINGDEVVVGRQDQYKYHDAIYAGQVEDLRLNANKLDINKLREDAIRKAVSGTLRGKGKVPFTRVGTGVVEEYTDLGDGYSRVYLSHVSGIDARTELGTSTNRTPKYNVYIKSETTGFVTKKAVYVNFAGAAAYIYFANSFGEDFVIGDSVQIVDSEDYLSSEFDSLPWVDIIGDPERIAATFPDGVVGQWVPQIPLDDISQPFIFNRKSVQGNYSRIFTIDDGASWTKNTHTIQETLNRTDATFPDSRYVSLLHYESHSNFTEPSNNTVVVGDVGDVRFNSEYRVQRGNRLQHSLIGEIGKDSNVPYGNFKLTDNLILDDGRLYGNENNGFGPLHNPIEAKASSGNEGNSGVKALSTITEKNGLYYLQLHGAELKHTPITQADMTIINADSPTGVITKGKVYLFKGYDNALINRPIIAIADNASITWRKHDFDGYTINSIGQVINRLGNVDPLLRAFDSHWGDDQTIPIIDGENVKTDLNGNTVKVFCHHTQVPLGIAHND
ncbi:hypothetical protein CWC18_00875 [Pseudoalteromonas aurantia]|uniref:hypothetical protein n=1 Tax=Pseudoalteromonas aurantia TaxID=43654 RepID=UPI00110BBEE4|nr:hypothetical protein [Pseudoalteromonas aurantia]TMO67238.1 hypothetical protein CWC18_00875 [Pseudoalteromonas aurantia]